MKLELRYALPEDVAAIAADARQADVDEFAALGATPTMAMEVGMKASDWSGTALFDGVPVCMFGVEPVSIITGLGTPWLVTTNRLMQHERQFIRHCRPVVDAMQRSYPRLSNLVADDNTAAKRWLRWMGFEINKRPINVNGALFRQFRKGEF
jgi:hypothetical protein